MSIYLPSRILVDPAVRDTPICRNVLAVVANRASIEDLASASVGSGGKGTLILSKNKGAWLKPCPGTTANYLCCGYNILNFASNCSMSCTYCILQSYFAQQELTVFCNTQNMIEAVELQLRRTDRPILRVGTGEFTDSLCLDHLTGFSEIIVPLFADSQRTLLELKTKTNAIDRLLRLDPKGRIVVSWSMNSAKVSEGEEHGVASLSQRLAAARKCEDAGYRIGFHFDPIVLYPGWETGYRETVNLIFDSLRRPERLAWISMGCLRYPASLNELIKKRFPQSRMPFAEFIPGADNKLRYPKPLRIQVYRKMDRWIRERYSNARAYLCMESPSVWEAALGRPFTADSDIACLLDEACPR